MKLDVVILSRRDPLYLDKVLNSIKKEISFHRLIFVANSPTDRALNLVKRFGGEIYIENYGSLGKAREYAITLVDCPYFILVDDDCVLRTNFMELTKYLEVNVGAIEGLDYIMNPRRQLYAEAMEVLAKKLGKKSRTNRRGFTGDTLIRTDVVKNIKIPLFLKVYEDQYIKNYIESKGYKWIKATNRYYCNHYDFKSPRRAYLAGICAKKLGYLSTMTALFNFIKIFPKAIFAWAKTGYWNLVPFQIKFYLYYLVGSIRD